MPETLFLALDELHEGLKQDISLRFSTRTNSCHELKIAFKLVNDCIAANNFDMTLEHRVSLVQLERERLVAQNIRFDDGRRSDL
jgi:hypothetical protein